MTQYITIARAKEAMRSSYDGSDDTALGDVLTSCSSFLDTFCQRSPGGFLIQNYDELYNGTGETLLFLNNTPVISISRIACLDQPALSIRNNDPDLGVRALASITATGLVLTLVKNAVTTTTTLTWASYPTVNQLVAAVNLLGSNWTSTVMGGFGTWSTSDLRSTQGAFGCRITTAYLWIHSFDLPWYRINEAMAEVYSPFGFHRGVFNWRVQYTAGYVTVSNNVPSGLPDDLTQALAELTAATYYAREVNANMQSESIGPYSYTQLATKMFDGMSPLARNTFNRYKIRRISKWGVY